MEDAVEGKEMSLSRVETSGFSDLYEGEQEQPGPAQGTAQHRELKTGTACWLTVDEAAKRLNISGNAVVKRLGKGKLVGQKVAGQYGEKWLVDPSCLPEEIVVELEANYIDATAKEEPKAQPGTPQEGAGLSGEAEAVPGNAQGISGDTMKVLGEIIQTQNDQLKRQNELIFHLTEELRHRDGQIKLLMDSQKRKSAWTRFWVWFTGQT